MPGAIDANGIWQYAEDDALASPTWSAYMNKLAASVSAGQARDAQALTTATLASGITAFSPNFSAAQLVRNGKQVWFAGTVTMTAAVSTGQTIWTLPTGWLPATDSGAHMIGWVGTGGAARFQLIGGQNTITYQTGGTPAAGTYAMCQGHWVIP